MYFPSEVKGEHFILCANTLVLARGVSGDPSKVYKSFYSVKLVITCKATRRLLLWNYLFIYFSSAVCLSILEKENDFSSYERSEKNGN